MGRIELSGEQTLLRFVEADRVAQFRFTKFVAVRTIEDEPVALRDALHHDRLAFAALDCVAGSKPHAPQRRTRASVFALLSGGFKFSGNSSIRDSQNRA